MSVDTNSSKKGAKKEVLLLYLADLEVVQGFNVREDYGDMEELENSIIMHGIKEPLSGYLKDGKYYITNGHRRYAAVHNILLSSGQEIKIPFILESKGYSDAERVLDMIIRNSGKKLSMLEEAKVYVRLLAYGWSEDSIATQSGKSLTHINNCFILNSVPESVKNDIRNGVISPTNAIELMRKYKDGPSMEEVMEGLKSRLSEGGQIKRKDVNKVSKDTPVYRTVKDFEAAYKAATNYHKVHKNVPEQSLDLLSAVISYAKGTIDMEEFMRYVIPDKKTE